MTGILRLGLGIGVLVYFVVVVYLLKRRRIDLKYTLIWLLAGICMAVLLIWPDLLYAMMDGLGISVPVNGLFLICIGFVIAILMSLTAIVSRQTERIKQLVQHEALLERRIRELEKKEEMQSAVE